MNHQKIIGTLLALLGSSGLIYIALFFVINPGGVYDFKAYIIFTILGLIFLIAGIGRIRTSKIEHKV